MIHCTWGGGGGGSCLCASEQRFVTGCVIPTHVPAVRVTTGSLPEESWALGATSPVLGQGRGAWPGAGLLRLCWT